ncbi:uncharacterized protein LOC130230108 [Danio aesculapii]|uniref:uncharacterized protein LOC130230108 n=1 Tax=Danio aesculapii TaxID=1142201 RepID=UPI0024BF85C0|nr:uncharacterized protein LOC130230108 [Danio aesculapii]
MAFLGLMNYCRQWIPDCSYYDRILRLTLGHTDPMQAPVQWTSDMNTAYHALKAALCSAPALRLPNYDLPFHLYVTHHGDTASAVLAQEHGGSFRPCAYLSRTLDTVARGLPACLKAIAAASIMVQDAEKMAFIVITKFTKFNTLKHLSTQHLSVQRCCGYEQVLLATENLEVKPTNSMDTIAHALQRLLNVQVQGVDDDHDCLDSVVLDCSIRPDLMSTPIPGVKNLYVDGSCSKSQDGVYLTGYAVCELPDKVIEAAAVPFSSAQAAKLIALTRACHIAAD